MTNYEGKALDILETLRHIEMTASNMQSAFLTAFCSKNKDEVTDSRKLDLMRVFFGFVDDINRMSKEIRGHEMWLEELRLKSFEVKKR